MKPNMMKFSFMITIFIYWSTISIAKDDYNFPDFPNEILNETFDPCKDDIISLNFNAVISYIGQDFISSSLLTCLNLMDNNIQNIDMGAFNKLPNLTKLFLSNNKFDSSRKLLSFGGHEKLEVLFLNNVTTLNHWYYTLPTVEIFGKYPNLKILSIRHNGFMDWQTSPEEIPELYSTYPKCANVTQEIPFPKLEILDISENGLRNTNFMRLLPNSLRFVDLHENKLEFLDLNKIGSNLSVLNLDNNQLRYVTGEWNDMSNSGLILDGLKNMQYLSISRNEIESMQWNTFQNTEKLVYLNLSRNNINYLEPELFAKLQSLSILDLSFNKFDYVPHVSNKTNISFLYLNHNQIKELNPNIFIQTPKLTKLFLKGNAIHKITVKAFDHLFVLEELDLSWNNLNFLPDGWTEPFVSLKYLDLSHNKFTSLESLSLTSALPLIEVYLAMNSLEYLNIRYFENLPQNLTVYLM